jgi:hypothetical protein
LAAGECWTLDIGASHSDASGCSLSAVLETGAVPPRYFLSPKACAGILRRAAKRGKELPGPLLRASPRGSGYRNDADTADDLIAFDTTQITSPANRSQPRTGDPCHPLASRAHAPAVAYGGNDTRGPIEVATALNAHGGPHGRLDFESETFVAHAFDARQSDVCQYGDIAAPLDTDGHTMAVWQGGSNQDQVCSPDGVAPTLAFAGGTHGGHHQPKVMDAAIRRLTPVECERLMGFPDGHTAIPYRGKPAADGPRYRALGNSMAVPVVRWLLTRIEAQLAATATEENAA